MELIFASHNAHKVSEMQLLMPSNVTLASLSDIGFNTEIVENGNTFEENASIKAETIFSITQKAVFADDSGIIANAIFPNPGIFSARYAGKNANAENNNKLLLKNLETYEDKSAYFYCCIVYINTKGKKFIFDGKVNGTITAEKMGNEGFGYDPIFIPNGYNITFAEMQPNEKNAISHRAIAVAKFKQFLQMETNEY